ncbi:MAG TPA: ATP-binding protein [Phototrophicaceae bacterium]|nr:ATP-binding protein [Phototrophicaceae bacterium]
MATLVNLAQNISLLLALTFIYGLVYPRLDQLQARAKNLVNGLLFGTFGVISMTIPIQVEPGFFLDGRTVVVCIAGIYGGPISALIAALMTAFYRFMIGGLGVSGALASITIAGLLGIAIRRYYQQRQQARPNGSVLLGSGIVLALQGTLWGLLLSHASMNSVQITLPTSIIIYPLGLLLLGELINNQQRALEIERALQDSERRFKAIFDSSFQLTGLLKPDGTILEANQAALEIGRVSRDEVVGQPFSETRWWGFSDEWKATIVEAIDKAAQGEFVRYEVSVSGANGRVLIVDFSIKPVFDDKGQVVLLIPEGRDITLLKELEQQKVNLALERERAQLLKKFISDVSHDLRTPLSVIRLNLELLRRTNDSPKQQQRIETLSAQEQHLTRLLTDMMVMLTLDDEQTAFQFKRIDVNFVAQLVFDRTHSTAQRKQQTLVFNRAAEALIVNGDQLELERALSKLMDNALNYTPKGGTITIATLAQDTHAVIEIQDTGVGISEEDLGHIFQRFYRADAARSMDTGGTGLGLPIAQKIVDAHKGEIGVESTVNVGSTFRVLLPLCVTENTDGNGHQSVNPPVAQQTNAL